MPGYDELTRRGDGCFGRTIGIHEDDIRKRTIEPLRDRVTRQNFAPYRDTTQREPGGIVRQLLRPLLPISGRQVRDRDVAFLQNTGEFSTAPQRWPTQFK